MDTAKGECKYNVGGGNDCRYYDYHRLTDQSGNAIYIQGYCGYNHCPLLHPELLQEYIVEVIGG